MILDDPTREPDEELLIEALGDNYDNYTAVKRLLERRQVCGSWRYYKDGKHWLCKWQYRAKTVCWLSVWDDCFKLSFYFNDHNKGGVEMLDIDDEIKRSFREQIPSGRLSPLLIEVRDSSHIEDIRQIVEYKIKG